MLIKNWAFAALSLLLTACSGSDGGPDKDHGVGDDDDDTTLQPGTGGAVIDVTLDGNPVTNAYVFLDGVKLGQVGETIVDLEPGDYVFDVGGDQYINLFGSPYYVANNEYFVAQVTVKVVKDEIVSENGAFVIAPQHQCVTTDCGWPYQDSRGACDGQESVDPPVWPLVTNEGIIMGAIGSTVDHLVPGIMMTLAGRVLADDAFTAESLDGSDIVSYNFSATEATVSVIDANAAFEVADQTVCSPL